MTLAFIEYEIPPMRAIYSNILESDEETEDGAREDVVAWALEKQARIRKVIVNPAPEDVPEWLRELLK